MKEMKPMNYLFLSFLPLLGALSFDLFSKQIVAAGMSMQNVMVVSSMLYVAFAGLLLAFIAGTKVKDEQKYILYLVVLFVTAIKVVSMFTVSGVISFFG